MLKYFLTAVFLVSSLAITSQAAESQQEANTLNAMDELDPFAADIETTLENLDKAYQEETGVSPFINNLLQPFGQGCVRAECPVWIQVVRSQQKLYLHLNGVPQATWLVSTGAWTRHSQFRHSSKRPHL